MSAALAPRAVIARRPTELELLVAQHGTRAQAAFFLERQGLRIVDLEERHRQVESALAEVRHTIPGQWRQITLLRSDFDRFVFEDNDVIVAVGQDGLVANVAKYLNGQDVIGVNPDPSAFQGILVPHEPAAVGDLLADCLAGRVIAERRAMVEAVLDDGQRLSALNEIYIGHHSHQSARYRISSGGSEERQSSSGIIISTGTGATGWARSINEERQRVLQLPMPEEQSIAYFVREAFPGSGFTTNLTFGRLNANERLRVISEMNSGGVLFGDGIEDDRIEFLWGNVATVAVSNKQLRLVKAATDRFNRAA